MKPRRLEDPQTVEKSAAIVSFGTGLLGSGAGIDGLDNDQSRVVLTRAVLDNMPEIASELLANMDDVRNAIGSLLGWIAQIRGDKNNIERILKTRLDKLRGLIDSLAKIGKLPELIKQIKDSVESDQSGYGSSTFTELAVEDTARLRLLFEAAEADVELIKVLLRINGGIGIPGTGNDVLFPNHGLLCAAAFRGNKEATGFLLDATKRAEMAPEMFLKYSLIATFGYAARSGDAAALKKIVELVRKAEQDNPVAYSGGKPSTTSEAITYYQGRFKMPEEADAVAILLIGDNFYSHGPSNLAKVLASNDKDAITFVANLLTDDPRLFAIVRSILASRPKEPSVSTFFDFLSKESKPVESKNDSTIQTLEELIASLSLSLKQSSPQRPQAALAKSEPERHDLPAEFNQRCYQKLAALMKFLDEMSQVSGKNNEWARRLTLIFDDAELAKDYVRSAIRWAMERRGDAAVWQHRTVHNDINWPEDITKESSDYIPQVDAIEVALGFEFPSKPFDSKPWRELLINHPEAARYIVLAPEIEAYLSSRSQQFPNTIEALREVVLEVDIERCKFSEAIAQNLRKQLKSENKVEEVEAERKLRSGVLIAAIVPPAVKDCMRRLAVMGLLNQTTATKWGEHLDQETPFYVVVENGKPRESEDGTERWPMEHFQSIVPTNDSLGELSLVAGILNDVHAIPNKCGSSITLDMREMEAKTKLELIKQLCVSLVRLMPNDLLRHFLSSKSPLHKDAHLNKEQIVEALLKASSIDEVFNTYSDLHGPLLRFWKNDALFRIEFPEISVDRVNRIFQEIQNFVAYCIRLMEENSGLAKDLTKESDSFDFKLMSTQIGEKAAM